MSTYDENLRRFRVASVTGRLPPDLAAWAHDLLAEGMPAAERVASRNKLLCEAAALMSGSTWAKANRIRDEIMLLRRAGTPLPDDAGNVQSLVGQALRVDPNTPTTPRQLFSILKSGLL